MSRPEEILKRAAGDHNCTYTPYNQMSAIQAAGLVREEEGGKGICFGLAVVWLEQRMNEGLSRHSKNAANFAGKADDHLSAVFTRSKAIFLTQSDPNWRDETLLVKATDGNDEHKTKNFEIPEETTSFMDWVCKSGTPRYFLVEIPKHMMAAFGHRTGRIQFFDPNAGIVSSNREWWPH